MEERGGKTIMCSVLFLDIVEYSKKSVAGQISLKDRFNSYLSAAIGNVPLEDRIILDTGDGAAINFLGDVEDALKAALSLRESMLGEAPDMDPPLLVRMGINLGPVRLVRDINGQPNIVGDGINVAQRVMGFADAAQILVSRSYYDAVSRLSPQYADMFHYQGSRTDKHVREHEVYAIGYPGDKTAPAMLGAEAAGHAAGTLGATSDGGAQSMAARLALQFRQASPKQRIRYGAMALIPLVLVGILVLKPARKADESVQLGADQVQAASGSEPASAVAPASPSSLPAGDKTAAAGGSQAVAKPGPKPDAKKPAEPRESAKKTIEAGSDAKKPPESRLDGKKTTVQHKPAEQAHKDTDAGANAEHFSGAHISIDCPKGTQLFVGGAEKGKVESTGLTVAVAPGRHKVIIAGPKGNLHNQEVELAPGKTLKIKPVFCE